jgi:hypothetical protein
LELISIISGLYQDHTIIISAPIAPHEVHRDAFSPKATRAANAMQVEPEPKRDRRCLLVLVMLGVGLQYHGIQPKVSKLRLG